VIDAVEAGFTAVPHATAQLHCRAFELTFQIPIWAESPQGAITMDEDNKVVADARESFGKGAARKIRAAGKIPAVVYGHGTDPQHITLPAHQVGLLIRKANAVLDLQIAGKSQLALVKDVQKDPVHQIIEHIDLLVVKKGEKIQVDVPISVIGESAPGTIAAQDANTVLLEVEATHIPERIELDVEGLEEGTHITAADLTLPRGASLIVDPETLIVAISVPSSTLAAEDEIAELDAAVAAAQALESEAETEGETESE
jgi:large subunit ribosomal protein L25